MSAAPIDPRELRNALGTFVTGVTIVTTMDADGRRYGVTANSFSSVSLDPPLVLWSQSIGSSSFAAYRDSDRFVINILAADQVELSNKFAKSGGDKFEDVAVREGLGGLPVIDRCAANLECLKVAAYPGGDHVVYLGRVERLERSVRKPLAFSSGRYALAYAHDLGAGAADGDSHARLAAERSACAALPEIGRQLGYTVSLAVWANKGPTIICWEPSSNPISANLQTGVALSVTQSATGIGFAAHLPGALTQGFVQRELQELGLPGDEFANAVGDARQQGLSRAAVAKESALHKVSINAFCAPVFDASGTMLLALTVTGRATELAAEWDGDVPTALRKAAAELSYRFGYRAAAASKAPA